MFVCINSLRLWSASNRITGIAGALGIKLQAKLTSSLQDPRGHHCHHHPQTSCRDDRSYRPSRLESAQLCWVNGRDHEIWATAACTHMGFDAAYLMVPIIAQYLVYLLIAAFRDTILLFKRVVYFAWSSSYPSSILSGLLLTEFPIKSLMSNPPFDSWWTLSFLFFLGGYCKLY